MYVQLYLLKIKISQLSKHELYNEQKKTHHQLRNKNKILPTDLLIAYHNSLNFVQNAHYKSIKYIASYQKSFIST